MAFANASLDDRELSFKRHLLTYVPLAGHVQRVLEERRSHGTPQRRFADELEDDITPQAPERTRPVLISHARYAEACVYDDEAWTFSLEEAA